MSTFNVQNSDSFLTKRRVGMAGIAGFIGCAACCAAPFLAAAGLGSGALASLTSLFRPGSELLVGGVVFVVALGLMAVGNRLKSRNSGSCGSSSCDAGGCRTRSTARRG